MVVRLVPVALVKTKLVVVRLVKTPVEAPVLPIGVLFTVPPSMVKALTTMALDIESAGK